MAVSDLYQTRRYRLIWWKRWPLFILGLIALEILRTTPEMMANLFSAAQESMEGREAIGLITLLMLVMIALLLLLIGELVLSYIEVSPTGIRYRMWPFDNLTSTWNEIESISTVRLFGFFPVHYLNLAKAQRVSFAATTVQKYTLILSDFRGWPNGQLAEDLKQHIPNLISNVKDVQRQS